MPTPYLMLRNDGFVRANHDGRSLGRISAFNDIAASAMAEGGIPVIDNVSPTLPYITLSSDNAHYTDPWILSVQPLLVFHQINKLIEAKLADGPGGAQGAQGARGRGGALQIKEAKRACAKDTKGTYKLS